MPLHNFHTAWPLALALKSNANFSRLLQCLRSLRSNSSSQTSSNSTASVTSPASASSFASDFLPSAFSSTPALRKYVKIADVEALKLEAETIERNLSNAEKRAIRRAVRSEKSKQRVRDNEHPYTAYSFTVAIVGRPNVGKSSLFNRLLGKRQAIVDGSSGVTRDWNDGVANFGGLEFRLIDTAGLEEVDWSVMNPNAKLVNAPNRKGGHKGQTPDTLTPFGQPLAPEKRSGRGIAAPHKKQNHALPNRDFHGMSANYALGRPLSPDLQQNILDLTQQAVMDADIVIFMVDIRAGITPLDEHFARWLRKIIGPSVRLTDKAMLDSELRFQSREMLRAVSHKPVIVLANKFDYGNTDMEERFDDVLRLGLSKSDPIAFSAVHATGIGELFSTMVKEMEGVLRTWDTFQDRVKEVRTREATRLLEEATRDLSGIPPAVVLAEDEHEQAEIPSEVDTPRRGIRRPGASRGSLRPSKLPEEELKPVVPEKRTEKTLFGDVMDSDDKPDLEREEELEERERETIRVVVAGKPNVGKSTLINALIGEQRLLTGPQPGVTRDSVRVNWVDQRFPQYRFELVDTAGMRGTTLQAHSHFDRVDSMAMHKSAEMVRKANVVVLVIDIVEGLYGQQVDPVFAEQINRNFVRGVQDKRPTKKDMMMAARERLGRRTQQYAERQLRVTHEKSVYEDKLTMLVSRVAGAVSKHDMDVARLAVEEGRSLVIIANKIDLLRGGEAEIRSVIKGLEQLFMNSFSQAKGVTIIPMAAAADKNVDILPNALVNVYKKWDSRINTGLLNRWLRALTVLKPPPNIDGRPLNLKYVTQTNVRPPTFSIFCSRKSAVPETYISFLKNSIREEFDLEGVPIRMHIRAGTNPYVEDRVLSKSEIRRKKHEAMQAQMDKRKSYRRKH